MKQTIESISANDQLNKNSQKNRREQLLYNLLYIGRITLKEYLEEVNNR